MEVLLSTLLAFCALIVVQLLVWRVRRPSGQYVGLGGLSLSVLVVSLAGMYAIQLKTSGSVRLLPATGVDYFNFVVLYTALVMAYMTTYSAVQADSPTMAILLRIEQAGSKGLSLEEMLRELDDGILVMPRLDDLVTSKLVSLQGGRYVIQPRGALLAKTQKFYRALLGMEKGG